ncbi:MAG: hypothetical protein ACRDRS_10260 [Pseudonocardiaceae bacterium]
MSGRGFPHLGRDPAPGDVELTRGVARQIGVLGAELGSIADEVSGARGDEWRGQTAEAFRATLRDELLPLLNEARDSFDRAGRALVGWTDTLASFQAEAQALERVAADRQATLDAARRALNDSPNGADATTLSRLDDTVAHATRAVSQLAHQADELHDRYLRAASSVASELEQAERIAPEPGWLGRTAESVRSWIEKLHEPWDLLAGDLWLDLAVAKGTAVTNAVATAVEELPELLAGRWSEVSALAHDADLGLASWDDVAVAARRFTTISQAAEFFTEDWAKRTGWIGKTTAIGRGFGRLMGFAGIVGDAFTIYDPPDQGVLGNVDRVVAVVNAGLIAANLILDVIPVVGEVVMIGTGFYLAGDYAYHHWPWFHDSCDTVGHTVARGAKTVWNGVKTGLHWITS